MLLLALLLPLGLTHAAAALPKGQNETAATLRGPINPQSARQLVEELNRPSVRELVLDSRGGDEHWALQIAKVVRTRRIRVVVNGVCLSACSQYILLGAVEGEISPGSLVGFHHSSYAIHQWSRAHAHVDTEHRALASGSAALSEQTRSMLSSDERLSLLRRAFRAVLPTCLAPPSTSGSGLPRIWMKASFWVPPAETLARLGIRVPANWPRNMTDAIAYVRASGNGRASFAFGDDPSLNVMSSLPALSVCA